MKETDFYIFLDKFIFYKALRIFNFILDTSLNDIVKYRVCSILSPTIVFMAVSFIIRPPMAATPCGIRQAAQISSHFIIIMDLIDLP